MDDNCDSELIPCKLDYKVVNMTEKCPSEMIPLGTSFKDNPQQLAIEGKGLIYQYGKKQRKILKGIDICLKRGEIYGLLGPSGCGKTTLLRCIVGRLKPKSGSIRIYGRDPSDEELSIPGRGIGYMPQELALYSDITVKETLNYFGSLYFMKSQKLKERIRFLLDFLEIKHSNSFVRNLSGGEKRRVSFASALIHEPPILILDEPTVGVDPVLRHSIWNHLKELTAQNQMTIIITTHYVEEARKANTVGLMREGHLLAEMNPEALIQKFSAQTLEDVFWKLCQKDDNQTEEDLNNFPTMTDENHFTANVHTENACKTHEELRKMQRGVVLHSKNHETKINSFPPPCDEEKANFLYPKLGFFLSSFYSLMRMMVLINKSFICLKRNTVFALFQLFVPLFQVVIFCLCVGQEPFDLPIAISNNETNMFGYSDMFINTLSNRTFKKVQHENLESAISAVKNGHSWGAIHIGPKFSSSLTDRFLEGNNVNNETIYESTIDLYLDMTNQQIAFTIYAKLVQSFEMFGKKMLSNMYQNPSLSESPIMVKQAIHGSLDPNFSEYLAPGIMLGMVHVLAIGLTLLSIIAEKNSGLLDRCWVAGVSASEMIIGIISPLFLTMLGQIVLVLVFTILLFNIPMLGSIFWAYICLLLAGLTGMAYGLLLSAICDVEVVAVLLGIASYYPIFILSGSMWPVEGMVTYLRYFSYCLPLTLLGDTMRSIMLRGWSITDHYIWVGIVVASGWSVFLLVLSSMIFKFRLTRS